MINRTKAREIFHRLGIQITYDTARAIDPYVTKVVEFAAENAANKGIKRITVDNIHDLITMKNIDNIVAFNAVKSTND